MEHLQESLQIQGLADNFADQYWRLTNLYKVSDKQSRSVLYTPNFVQQRLFEHESPAMVVLKARQQGVSTWGELLGFDEVLWNSNYWVAIIAHERNTLDILFTKIQFAWDNLDTELKAYVGEPKSDNKYELYWRHRNSRIYVSLQVLGGTNQRVHFSEYALIDDQRIANTLPTVPPTGRIVKESTPFGTGNKFYRDYVAAKAEESSETAHFFAWWLSPEYRTANRGVTEENLSSPERSLIDNHGLDFEQIQWRRDQWKELKQPDGSNLFQQTYIEDDISCFMASGDAVFDAESVKSRLAYVKNSKKVFVSGHLFEKNKRIRFSEDDEGPLRIYEAPKREGEYSIGSDVSLGGPKSDDQVSAVLRRGSLDLVAMYVNRTEIGIFAEDTANLAKFYNMAHICPERNSIGEAFIEHLLQLYPNEKIYRQQNRLQTGSKTRVSRYGYATTRGRNVGKQRLITLIQDWLRDNILIWDIETLEQMLAYQRLDLISPQEGYKMGAKAGNKDDRIIGVGLALEMDAVLPAFRPKLELLQDAWDREFTKAHKRTKQLEPHWAAY